MIKKKDIILLLCVLLIAGIVFFVVKHKYSEAGVLVKVTVDGTIYGEYDLNKDQEVTIETEHGFNKMVIKDGWVRMEEADCKDQYCVLHDPISLGNETIICLPHKVVIEVVGGEISGLDA